MSLKHTPDGPRAVRRIGVPFDVEMALPGSKSFTLRNMLLAALAQGVSEIREPGECDDFTHMKTCLEELGVRMTFERRLLKMTGTGGRFAEGVRLLDCGMSAASTRFLLALAALRESPTQIDGHPALRRRPQGELLNALARLGADVTSLGSEGHLPASVQGPLTGDQVSVDGGISSQYISALLQIGPLLPRGLRVDVKGELVSRPYLDITLSEMAKFGVYVEHDPEYRSFRVPHSPYRATSLTVEGDASAASYLMALATIHGGRVVLTNLGTDTLQGDYAFGELCERLGATITRTANSTVITGPEMGRLERLDDEIDMESMPDVAPTLMAIAPLIPGNTVLTGLATLRVKECDRIAVPAANLKRLAVPVIEGPDFIEVGELASSISSTEVGIDTRHDHRMAMSFAVLGTRLGRLRIRDPLCVNKTYPLFWQDLETFYAH